MKFYALVIWRTRGVVPAMLQLVYLGNGEMLRYEPDEADLLATERKVEAIWRGDPARRGVRRLAARTGPGCATGAAYQAHLPRVRRHPAAAARSSGPATGGSTRRRPRHRRGRRRPA